MFHTLHCLVSTILPTTSSKLEEKLDLNSAFKQNNLRKAFYSDYYPKQEYATHKIHMSK
jgi:hypothetical protein